MQIKYAAARNVSDMRRPLICYLYTYSEYVQV